MPKHPVEELISKADSAINQEDFDTLVGIYDDDAVLVVRPGVNARGKDQIRKAFMAIADHFGHSLHVEEAGMDILEAGDTALVLAKTIVRSSNSDPAERKATYVFKRNSAGGWLCIIDNSYGHDLLEQD